MPTIRPVYTRVDVTREFGYPCSINALARDEYAKFGPGLLDLGEVASRSDATNSLAVVLDLEGFTEFCNQVDPQLFVPAFIGDFLDWIFQSIRKLFTESEEEDKVRIWGSLPFFGKFTGDGAPFLWDTDLSGNDPGIGNIILRMVEITDLYLTEFYPRLQQHYSKVPRRLRVGIARGQVLSIGKGKDYVGPCINIASRIQKLSLLSFAASRRGINPDKCFSQGNRIYSSQEEQRYVELAKKNLSCC